MNLEQIITKHWYGDNNLLLAIVLAPLAFVFWLVSQCRYFAYKFGVFKVERVSVPVPVVVIGNLSVGGNGKTPLTQYLYQQLEQRGMRPAIILRGYKAELTEATVVQARHNAHMVGDEAYNYFINGCRVAIASKRVAAAKLLLASDPDIDIILSDDGLQHYSLARDYEVCVIDGVRGFGNQYVLPLGPLREPISRLSSVQHLVVNSMIGKLPAYLNQYSSKISLQQLKITQIKNYTTNITVQINQLAKLDNLVAVCALGNPERFYSFLEQNGITGFIRDSYPDHYVYQVEDLARYSDKLILTTSKDYVKQSSLGFNNIYVVEVASILNSDKLLHEILMLKDKLG